MCTFAIIGSTNESLYGKIVELSKAFTIPRRSSFGLRLESAKFFHLLEFCSCEQQQIMMKISRCQPSQKKLIAKSFIGSSRNYQPKTHTKHTNNITLHKQTDFKTHRHKHKYMHTHTSLHTRSRTQHFTLYTRERENNSLWM